MAESKYHIIKKEEQDINSDPEDADEEEEEEEDDYTENFDDDTVTIITSSNHESHSIYPNKFNSVDIMQTPAAILALILVYFAFSIGLTFYQRSLLKVNQILCVVLFFFPLNCGLFCEPTKQSIICFCFFLVDEFFVSGFSFSICCSVIPFNIETSHFGNYPNYV